MSFRMTIFLFRLLLSHASNPSCAIVIFLFFITNRQSMCMPFVHAILLATTKYPSLIRSADKVMCSVMPLDARQDVYIQHRKHHARQDFQRKKHDFYSLLFFPHFMSSHVFFMCFTICLYFLRCREKSNKKKYTPKQMTTIHWNKSPTEIKTKSAN